MKLFASVALAATLLSSAAMAQSALDFILPSFTIGPYAGIRGGYATSQGPLLGANLGYDLGLLRVEADYDRLGFRSQSANLVTTNAIVQYPFRDFTPYVLAGVGYEWRNSQGYFADTANWASGSGVWNLGGGIRYPLTEFIELDGRYRYVQTFKYGDIAHPYQRGDASHVFTTGLNVRF